MGNKLAELIKNAREAKNISQRELSRQTGIDNNTISQIEKGERKKPNSLSLIKLSKALDLSLEALMEASGYNADDIEMTYSMTPSFQLGKKRILDAKDMLADIESKIANLESTIEMIKKSIENHDAPVYKDMSKKDIDFFDNQSKQILSINNELLKVYKEQAEYLKHIVNKTTGFTMKKYGMNVLTINGDKID